MKIKLFLLFFLNLFFLNANAQDFNMGKVSIKELQEKSNPNDTTAAAAILFNKARTFFSYDSKNGFSIDTENTFRIKIYKKEGLSWANFKLPYRIGYENLDNDTVEFSDCVTFNFENGKVVKTKLNNEGAFKTTINKYWKEVEITMPNVKIGSIVEFKYLLKSENIVEFPKFNFQYDIPVNYSEYTTQIPGFFVYKAVAKRSSDLKFTSNVEAGSLSYTVTDGSQRTESISFQQAKNTYSAYNIPALLKEPFVDNIENYRLSIIHELEKTQFYQEPVKNYSMTWDGVAKTIYEDEDFGNELQEREYLRHDLTLIIKDIKSFEERLDVIFKFVQNKMNWNGKRGYNVEKGVKQAYVDGTGNTAEINFILISMLNFAGIKALPVLISTIDNGIPVYPNRTIFNYVIAAVEIDGNQILLDASNKNTTRNILPLNTINWSGRLIDQDGVSQEVQLVPSVLSKKAINMIAVIDDMGKISGKYQVQRTDYEAFTFRDKFLGINQQDYLEKLESDFKGLQISSYSIENDRDFTKPLIETFSFFTDVESEIIGDKIYINPKLFFTQTKNPFVQEERQFPIYFGFSSQEKFNISIAVPKGYVVESIPKPIRLQTKESMVSYAFNIEITNNNIQIAIIENRNKQFVSSEYYGMIKDFYKQMIEKQNEKIVLKKI